MERPRILVTTPFLPDEAWAMLSAIASKVETTSYPTTDVAVEDAILDFDPHAILSRTYKIGASAINGAPSLRVISKHGTGIDNIDLGAAKARGIVVTNCFGINAPAVAEHALALMLALAKNLSRHDREVRAGHWSRFAFKANMLEGRRLGLVGFGQVARRLAEIAHVLGMPVIGYGPRFSAADSPENVAVARNLDDLLRASDIVSLHCPANETTRHLIGARELALMPKTAWLVNTARGSVVDEAALVDALRNSEIAAAALDCLATEPPAPDNPLLAMPNVVVTPHTGGATIQSTHKVGIRAAENLVAILEGRAIDSRAVVLAPHDFKEV